MKDLLLRLLPQGLQHGARRNAWAAMSEGAVRARGRREAEDAMALARQQAEQAAGSAARTGP